MPISTTGAGVDPIQSVIEQLEGAYAAQWYANRHDVANAGTAPLIQLLIANSGTQAAGYGMADPDIRADVEGGQHLVAVAGIGVSLDSTLAEVTDLTDNGRGIPVFASSITSDAFDNIDGLVRVSPSNRDEVRALLRYVMPKASSAILVEDMNSGDIYLTSLADGFTDQFTGADHKIGDTLTYTTAGETSPTDVVAQNAADRIASMPADICLYYGKGSVVLFAGRSGELATLLNDFADEPCPGHQITIVTGDDVANMPVSANVTKALESGVTLQYVGETNPQEWNPALGPVSTPEKLGFEQFSTAFTSAFPASDENDGNAMTGYDDILTSVAAIRLAADRISGLPNPAGVTEEENGVQGLHTLYGAGGPIQLSGVYTPGGSGSNPVNKVIPILQLLPSGQVAVLARERA
jgi:hypothetical protein